MARTRLGPSLPPTQLARLSPRFTHLLEAHLADERVHEALTLLLPVLRDGDSATADSLRYLALAGLLSGYATEASTILERALDEALGDGDLIGAIDALRRLDALGGDCDSLWTKALRSVVKRGFENVDQEPLLLEPPEELATELTVEDVFAQCLEAVIERPAPESDSPLRFVPLLAEFSDGDIRAAVNSLSIRLVSVGERLGSVCEGAPAWVVSGMVEHAEGEIAVPSGSLLLPGDDGPIAASPSRVLVIEPEVWASLQGDKRLQRILDDYRRKQRLAEALRTSPFYRTLPPDVRTEFVSELNCTTILDEPIIIRGYSVRGLFVMLHGQAIVALQEGDSRTEIARLEPGDVFGELDVLTAGGAEYDVHAEGEVDICFIDADTARDLLRRAPDARSRLVQLREARQKESLAIRNETPSSSEEVSV